MKFNHLATFPNPVLIDEKRWGLGFMPLFHHNFAELKHGIMKRLYFLVSSLLLLYTTSNSSPPYNSRLVSYERIKNGASTTRPRNIVDSLIYAVPAADENDLHEIFTKDSSTHSQGMPWPHDARYLRATRHEHLIFLKSARYTRQR